MAASQTTVGRALDALNFFLADVRDGLGPGDLSPDRTKWDEAPIGAVMSVAALAGMTQVAADLAVATVAMLPVVGQKLALVNGNLGTTLMSVCIIAAQLVTVPGAMLVGHKADVWGRKPMFAVALAVLTLRGALYPDNSYGLVPVQTLDGIGAVIFGALFPLVVADLTRGTAHFNISQGAIATAAGLGCAPSTAIAGFIIVKAGDSAALLFLAGVAGAGLIGFCAMMPETLPHAPDEGDSDADT